MEKKIRKIEGIGAKITDLRIRNKISQKKLCTDLSINEGALIRMISLDTFKDVTLKRILKYLEGENFNNSNNEVLEFGKINTNEVPNRLELNNYSIMTYQGIIEHLKEEIKEKDLTIIRLATEKGSLMKELGKSKGVAISA